MEAFLKESNRAKAVEVLYFEDAEVEKIKSDSISFAATGPLVVLYFKDYHRFVLQINDWRYPLIRRLRIVSNSDSNNFSSRSYFMPSLNGYTFNLKINKIHNNAAIINFETILGKNSDFSKSGEENPLRKIETSPDDKLSRKSTKETSILGGLAEKTSNFFQKMKAKTTTMKSGTKNITSTKKRIDMSKIKNKNYRKTAKSTFKKNFFEDNQKMTAEFMRLRNVNHNNVELQDINTLTKNSNGPAHYLMKEDIEEAILNNKDLASKGNYKIILGRTIAEKRNLLDEVRNDLEKMKDNFETKREELRERIHVNEAKIEEKMHVLESHHHYEA